MRNGNEGEAWTEIGKWGKERETEEERITKKRKKEKGRGRKCQRMLDMERRWGRRKGNEPSGSW